MELNYQGYQNIDNNPWSLLSEELGTWGNMALQLHTSKTNGAGYDGGNGDTSYCCGDDRKRGRSTTTTAFPMTGYIFITYRLFKAWSKTIKDSSF